MSAVPNRNRPATRTDQLRMPATPRLHIVEGGAQPRRSVLPLTLVVLFALVAAIVTPMLLNTRMAQTSFAIREQQILLNELNSQAAQMQVQIHERSSAISLEKAAKAQDMVPSGRPGIIRLADGTVDAGVAAQ
ncbi:MULTISPECIES: hypothetical protein [unclassified Schaalia]|uniref:hypothetical protein n=1 Tax=unclassified Schaalia TaxID=2691889 RepID=UPI001E3FC9FA|nr:MULTISPECIES: hypothetical protein [unclassified Schaalia]MCD4549237.1 hypothetical protein [Schaalia sp. lx-260]MCD4557046.1 hypothetical protein [Schaalia sp. lx-100]